MSPARPRSRPRKLTPQLEDNLAGEFSAGTPADELAAKYGVSRATAYRIAVRATLPSSLRCRGA
ncbi:hypothetical protein [Kribbella sindirgiensis]|uniref:hypothetical protein n=1 Tax=Kribbella sindirgiensis TaxID=1124744 RepID=UPI00103DDD8E|nr:hypothetical protein [Kribbella sindirgiensis]